MKPVILEHEISPNFVPLSAHELRTVNGGGLVDQLLHLLLAGSNTAAGALIPVATTLMYITGLVLILLENLNALGIGSTVKRY